VEPTQISMTSISYQNWDLIFSLKKENTIFSENSIMQMRSKFTVEYLKTRGVQNSSDNGIEFLGSLLVRISCQTNCACLNRSLHSPPGTDQQTDQETDQQTDHPTNG
jgi:hypothetical protein